MNAWFLFAAAFVALAALLFAWLEGAARLLARRFAFDEVDLVPTSDGALFVLGHVRPRSAPRDLPPVILCHGLAMNRHTFALDPERSLAACLARDGRDVWILELRGAHGDTRDRVQSEHSFDTYARVDLPAAIAEVRARTGAREVDWVGFSMGGMLAYAHLGALRGDGVRRLATLGSPAGFRGHPMRAEVRLLRPFFGLLRLFRFVPYRAALLLAAPLVWRSMPPVLTRGIRPANFSTEALRATLASSFGDTPSGVTLQFARWILDERFDSEDRSYDYAAGLSSLRAPLLVIAGSHDRLAPKANVFEARAAASVETRFMVVGSADGAREDYDHIDLVLGDRACDEVFPAVVEWLRAA